MPPAAPRATLADYTNRGTFGHVGRMENRMDW
jgi:hypothetical protein